MCWNKRSKAGAKDGAALLEKYGAKGIDLAYHPAFRGGLPIFEG